MATKKKGTTRKPKSRHSILLLPTDQEIQDGQCEIYTERFLKENNPLDALRAFIAAYDAGVPPPLPILEFLHKGFKDYLKKNGRARLDECLELSITHGQYAHFTTEKLKDRDQTLIFGMWVLRKLWNVSIEKASSSWVRLTLTVCGQVSSRRRSRRQ